MLKQSGAIAALLLTLVVCPGLALAQSIGAKGGVNFTSVSFEEGSFASDSSAGAGFTVGGVIGLKLFGPVFLQGEVLFTEQRVTLEEVVDDRFRMLEVPVLLRFRAFGTAPGMTVHVTGGVVYGSVLSAQETVSGETYDIKDAVESWRLGAAAGAEVEFLPRWTAGFRYVYGVSKIYRTFSGGEAGTPMTMQITVGYRFK